MLNGNVLFLTKIFNFTNMVDDKGNFVAKFANQMHSIVLSQSCHVIYNIGVVYYVPCVELTCDYDITQRVQSKVD